MLKEKNSNKRQAGEKNINLADAISFFRFLNQKNQKIELITISILYAILFFIIKYGYPYLQITPDSGSYILSAKTMTINGYRPIGYSWFLDFFHSLSNDIGFIFIGHFILNAFAQILFLFGVKYIFKLRSVYFYLLALPFILSPSILFSTNLIMSDSIFNSLTLLYLFSAMMILKKPKIGYIIGNLIVLYLIINVRYSAIYYPVLTSLILIFKLNKNRKYVIVSIMPLFLLLKMYVDTKAETKKTYKLDSFSGFSGWAMANNAVSILPYIDLNPDDIEDLDNKIIHTIVTSFPDSMYTHENINKTGFMWFKNFSGKRVLSYYMQKKKYSYVKAWIYTGSKFKDYGKFLISEYPFEYLKYYLYPNFKQLFYNYRIPRQRNFKVDDLIKEYYDYDINTVEYESNSSFLHKFNGIRDVTSILLWIILIFSLTYLFIKQKSINAFQKPQMAFLIIFFLCYCGLSVIAHPINNFRYLIPIYSIQLLIPILAVNHFMINKKTKKNVSI